MILSQDQLNAREAWLQKLELNDLPQTEGTMVAPTSDGRIGFCCLAVAEFTQGHRPQGIGSISLTIAGQRTAMSSATAEAMGFVENNPFLHRLPQWLADRAHQEHGYKYPPVSLSSLNDTYRLTFPEIASVIRLQPENWNGEWAESTELGIVP